MGPLNSLVKANVEYERIHVAHEDEENQFHSRKKSYFICSFVILLYYWLQEILVPPCVHSCSPGRAPQA